jgi:metal-responsive CopG/Arc/MetJ family transcriptional regulator
MKTAISLPDELFLLADQYAKNLGMSRSEFYATAVRAFILAQKRDGLTDRINDACAKLDTTLPEDIAEKTRQRLLEVEW